MLFKAGLSLCQSHPRLFIFPVLQSLSGIALFFLIQVPLFIFSGFFYHQIINPPGVNVEGTPAFFIHDYNPYLFWPLFLVTVYAAIWITVYFAVAFYAGVKQALNGEQVDLAQALALANSRISVISGWALISTLIYVLRLVVETILNKIFDGLGASLLTRILSAIGFTLADVAWSLAITYAIPVLAEEGTGPLETVSRSANTFKKTWGTRVIADGAAGLVIGLAWLVGAAAMGIGFFLVQGSLSGGPFLGALITLVVAEVVWAVVCGLAGTVMTTTFNAVLYRYSTTGDVVGPYLSEFVTTAFKPVPMGKVEAKMKSMFGR
jgi:hypothetical protein